MGLFDQFVYTNFHEMNMDWILNEVKNFKTDYAAIAKYIIMLDNDPAALAVNNGNRLSRVTENMIFEAKASDGWTDMPSGETDGCFINLIYYEKEVEYPLVPSGSQLVRDYNQIQLFINATVSGGTVTKSFYFRTVKSKNVAAVTTSWIPLLDVA